MTRERSGSPGERAYGAKGSSMNRMLVGFVLAAYSLSAQAQWTATILTPPGSTHTYGYGVSHGQQAGIAVLGDIWRAGYWSGSAASWVNLHPGSANSSGANGVSAGQQVGYVQLGCC